MKKYLVSLGVCFGCQSEPLLLAIPTAEMVNVDNVVYGGLFFDIYEDDMTEDPICEVVFVIEGQVVDDDCENCVASLDLSLQTGGDDCQTGLAELSMMKWRIETAYSQMHSTVGDWYVLEGTGWSQWGEVVTATADEGQGWMFTSLYALFL